MEFFKRQRPNLARWAGALLATLLATAALAVTGRALMARGDATEFELYPPFEMTYSVETFFGDGSPADRTVFLLTYADPRYWTEVVLASQSHPESVGSRSTYDGVEMVSHYPLAVPDVTVAAATDALTVPARWFVPRYGDGRFVEVPAPDAGVRVFRFERRLCEQAEAGYVLPGDTRCIEVRSMQRLAFRSNSSRWLAGTWGFAWRLSSGDCCRETRPALVRRLLRGESYPHMAHPSNETGAPRRSGPDRARGNHRPGNAPGRPC